MESLKTGASSMGVVGALLRQGTVVSMAETAHFLGPLRHLRQVAALLEATGCSSISKMVKTMLIGAEMVLLSLTAIAAACDSSSVATSFLKDY